MGDETTTTSGDEATTTTGTTTRRRPWEGRFGRSKGADRGADRGADSGGSTGGSRGSGSGHSVDVAKVRTFVARVLWTISAVFALILALTVLLIAVDANTKNELVQWLVARADDVDLGFFDLQNPIKDFDDAKGPADDVKSALFNYGIAAIVWLVIGKIADKVVRP